MSPRTGRPYHIGIPCHVIARGCARQAIFLDDQDCRVFVSRMRSIAAETKTSILGFCLMCNHYHLLAQRSVGTLSQFFQALNTSYAQYFNKKYGRVGYVFQGRPKLKRCLNDAYLKTVLRYIHLNPVKAGLVAGPGDWRWSSHANYAGTAPGWDFVKADALLDLFGGPRGYLEFVGSARVEDLPAEGEFIPSEEDVIELEVDERLSLEILSARTAGDFSIEIGRLRESRDHAATKARLRFVEEALANGYSRADLARYLGVAKSTITMMLRRKM